MSLQVPTHILKIKNKKKDGTEKRQRRHFYACTKTKPLQQEYLFSCHLKETTLEMKSTPQKKLNYALKILFKYTNKTKKMKQPYIYLNFLTKILFIF